MIFSSPVTFRGQCGLVSQLAKCLHGKREALGSSPGPAMIFLPCDSYTMVCLPVCEDNPQALASGLSPLQANKP